MKKTFVTLLILCFGALGYSQLNMTLLDQIYYPQQTNDIWGWVDPDDGTEYALVGTRTGVSVVSLADPENIAEVKFFPGATSTWRDIKTWGNYAYVTNEQANGLLVIDLTGAPGNITGYDWTPTIPGLGTLNTAHNIWIDEFGYAYIAGSNLNSGGVLFVDVFTTPGTPIFVAAAPNVYNHDTYTRGNIMYSSEIYAGELGIYDVSDKFNVVKLGSQKTPFAFTHNAWLNDAGDVVFTTDEKANAPIAAYNIADPTNIIELDQFKPIASLGTGTIPHNVHVWEDWLIISYYTDGGIIVDASKPDNLIEVGNWDTFLGGNGGFSGAWGAYPFLPSGLVLLTDIGNGLFVCGANYVRACWLEGTVTNSITGQAINNATIHIESTQANTGTTNSQGKYKTGQAIPGTFDVVFTAPGYFPKTVSAVLENGVLTILDVQLDPIFTFSGQTVRTADGMPVTDAQVVLTNAQYEFTATSGANGNFIFPALVEGTYTLYAGKWGYKLNVISNLVVDLNTPQPIVIYLEKGYEDDFAIDLGWTETHTASTGIWTRGEPIGTTQGGSLANPELDIDGDVSDKCYVTGNGGGTAANDDVDNGVVTLFSPVMDLTSYAKPVISYYTWFYNGGGNGTPNDALEVRITNGTDEVVLETITQSGSAWRPQSVFDLTGLITLTDNMQVIFETGDLPTSGHLVEAAVDAFLVEDASPYPPFSASATSGCLPFTVDFDDPSGLGSSWNWTFEGGFPATSSLQNPSVSYATPGVYDVTLVVTANDGNTYTINRPEFITVNDVPAADFSYTVVGSTVNFTNTTVNGGDYSWNFGDNINSNAQNPSHTYSGTGNFTVTLTATNACGTSDYSENILIAIVPPVASFTTNVTQGCAPLVVQFTDQSTGSPTSWSWSFPGGSPSVSSMQNPVVTYTTASAYSATLTATNAAGNSQVTQSQFITVSPVPAVSFTYTALGGVVTFTNTSQNGTSYSWNFGDNSTSTATNPVHTYTQNGNFEVTLTATNACGFSVSTQTVMVNLTGTADLDEAGYSMTASPNPFSHEVLINYTLHQSFNNANLLVFNVLGKQIASVELGAVNGSVALGQEIRESGVYFVRLVVDGKVGKAVKVVKI